MGGRGGAGEGEEQRERESVWARMLVLCLSAVIRDHGNNSDIGPGVTMHFILLTFSSVSKTLQVWGEARGCHALVRVGNFEFALRRRFVVRINENLVRICLFVIGWVRCGLRWSLLKAIRKMLLVV